jgi:cell division protein FtsB
LALLGWLGWLYGSRFLAIARLEAEVVYLRAEETAKLEEIGKLEEALARTDDPQMVEKWARRLLHFGFPGEERVIIIWR